FLAGVKGCRLINCYGPTENTTFTTSCVVERIAPGRSLPIGRPIANTTLHVLDERGAAVPLGAAGEAWVGGDGLARGYLDGNDAFVSMRGERLYRTGDRVRRRGDGNYEFLGRLDDQLKLRGVRVEPAEVEHNLRQFPGVRGAAVIADE